MINELIDNIKNCLKQFLEKHEDALRKKKELETLRKVVTQVDQSWSKSWIGFHASLYFEGFCQPTWNEQFDSEWGSIHGISNAWISRDYTEISAYIEENANIKLDSIILAVNKAADNAKEIQNLISSDLSILPSDIYQNELQIVKELGSHEWGTSATTILKHLCPKQLSSRDSFAVQQGAQPPPHLVYDSKIMATLSTISSIEDFVSKATKLLRQIELREKIKSMSKTSSGGIAEITKICKSFHQIARQLQNRHNNRETLRIEDEYDTQDLFHALLKFFFSDIRREEWTPSYAGSSARADFLIKDEKIVIEIKKTRTGLKDKEVGEQLIIDIAKYKTHPDCKILVCFVYDPEGRIGNPNGIERDLNQLSTNEMSVITIIEPK